ncbi:MAG TPA: hypothetical protein VG146_02220 [Verrucomicrobiae bacterium]|nr:hypothetical protein [Verrucomicrobiae bacterium]
MAYGLFLAASELGLGKRVASAYKYIHLCHCFQVDEVEEALSLDAGPDGWHAGVKFRL